MGANMLLLVLLAGFPAISVGFNCQACGNINSCNGQAGCGGASSNGAVVCTKGSTSLNNGVCTSSEDPKNCCTAPTPTPPTPSGGACSCIGCSTTTIRAGKTSYWSVDSSGCEDRGGKSYVTSINLQTTDKSGFDVEVQVADGFINTRPFPKLTNIVCTDRSSSSRVFAMDGASSPYPRVAVKCRNLIYSCPVLHDIRMGCQFPTPTPYPTYPTPYPTPRPTPRPTQPTPYPTESWESDEYRERQARAQRERQSAETTTIIIIVSASIGGVCLLLLLAYFCIIKPRNDRRRLRDDAGRLQNDVVPPADPHAQTAAVFSADPNPALSAAPNTQTSVVLPAEYAQNDVELTSI